MLRAQTDRFDSFASHLICSFIMDDVEMKPVEEEKNNSRTAAASSEGATAAAASSGKTKSNPGQTMNERSMLHAVLLTHSFSVLVVCVCVSDNLPWVEKYRPNALDELISHADIIHTINKLIDGNQLPHLLFYGRKEHETQSKTDDNRPPAVPKHAHCDSCADTLLACLMHSSRYWKDFDYSCCCS